MINKIITTSIIFILTVTQMVQCQTQNTPIRSITDDRIESIDSRVNKQDAIPEANPVLEGLGRFLLAIESPILLWICIGYICAMLTTKENAKKLEILNNFAKIINICSLTLVQNQRIIESILSLVAKKISKRNLRRSK